MIEDTLRKLTKSPSLQEQQQQKNTISTTELLTNTNNHSVCCDLPIN